MCKNGTLANRNGFDVDNECPLITIVDNEVVVRRGSQKTNSIANALISLDRYFQIDPDFKMYNSFNGITDLLFKVRVGYVTSNNNLISMYAITLLF